METVRCEAHAGIWTLTLARPPVNAANLELVQALAAHVARADASPDCQGLVIAAEGRAFCSGLDVKALPQYDAPTRAELLRTINRTLATLYALRKPTVAAVQGHALGAGLVLAIACDVRLAARGSFRLGLTEVTAGVPFPASPRLIAKAEIEPSLLRRLVLTGEVFGPEDPAAGAIFDAVLEPASLVASARERAAALAALRAYAAVKEQFRRETIAALRAVAESGDDPLMRGWL